MIFYQKPKYAKIEEELDNISYSAALKWLKIPLTTELRGSSFNVNLLFPVLQYKI